MKKNESQLKHACNKDSLLPTKIFLALCSKVQIWLGQCKIAKDRSKLNDNIVNFDNILEDLWDNCFTVNLPSVFKIIFNRMPPTVDNPFTEGKVQDKNRQKMKRENNEDVRVINEKADDDLKIKKGENWGNIFFSDKGKHRLKWNNDGVLMCPRWF